MTVTVTFLDSSTVWFEIEAEVLSRVPLCGITWLQHNRVQRLLDSINISFVPYKPDMFPRAVPGTATPFAVHLYLVNCDDPDLYKTSVKKQLSDWLAVIGAKKNQEPLIVYLGAPDANRKQAPSRLFGGSVADRIKSDFAKTNMIHLKPSHPKDVSIWNEFFAKLRELILASFNGKLLQYDEDTRRLDAQRLLPGWNYCQFFILKDGAACTYEFLNVHGEALMQYDELEAAFFQNLQEQGAPWFQSFGGSETGDDSHDILNVSRKPYRDLILQNTISIFDFRIYLFARQIQLLIKSPNGVVEACVRAKKFITSFARTLQEYSVGLVPYFTESWVYTACMSVIRHCDENIAESNASATAIPTSELNAYEGVKAELLHYARMQLDILGSASDLFTSSIHKVKTEVNAMMEHSTGNDGSPEEKKFPRETVSNKELKDALETAEAFDSLYLSISNRAVKGFEASQRKRTALLVKGDIASLYFHRAQYSEASAIWEQITTQFGGKGWESMDEAVLEKLVICQKELGRFGPLVDACLRLLATDSVKDTEKYVDFINGAAHDLKAEKNANGPTFAEPRFLKVNAVKFVNRIGNEDAHALELQIDNYLSKALKVQKVTSILAGKESAGLTCNVDDVLLNPGSNIVRLWCEKVSLAGMYVVESVKLGVGHALLEYGFPKSGVRKRSFHVFEQAEAMLLSVKVLPSEVTMAPHLYRRGVTRLFQVELSNPMKPIQSASVSAIPITSAVIPTITTATIQIKDNQTQTVIRQEDTPVKDRQISIPAFSTNETVTFTLPLTLNDSDVDFVSVKFVIVFTTASGSSMDEGGKEGTLSKTLDISAVPPLKISHTLIPRGSGILLQVLVVGGSSVPLRIDGVRLHGLKGFKVLDYSQWGDSLVFEGQTHSLVYLLEHSDSAFPRHGQKAKVVIKYHSTVDGEFL
ncbi:hypothetical protein BDR26DRAFT_195813 [Obelidium mucronatum]|nr:hypothetical protein BDR26DRAFT_195813 [Obelidium mucronatum]